MIVSASYRTDIPAFYGDWFGNRFRAGFARVRNPYGGPDSVVSLRDGVDGFVFWTRNAAPFRPVLAEVAKAGIPFVVQYTITNYPRGLESSVVEAGKAAEIVRALAAEYGPRALVWRYDPILVGEATPWGFHLDNFTRLAGELAGAVDECVISFAHIYKKTRRNLDATGLAWCDPEAEEKRDLAARLAEISPMRLSLCAQEDCVVPGTSLAACVDAARLRDVARNWGLERDFAARVKGNRPGCLCAESRDIGAYDSCPHGCAYCYAVGSKAAAKRRYAEHDPAGEFL